MKVDDVLKDRARLGALPLEGRGVGVSGGGGHLGSAVALGLAEAGALVVVCGRGADSLDAVVAEACERKTPGRVFAEPADVRSEEDLAKVLDRIIDVAGGLHGWVNNAYGGSAEPFMKITREKTEQTLSSGLADLMLATQEVATRMRALRRERLDVLLLHRALHRDAFEGALWDELCARRAAGEITQLGVSVANPGEAWNLLDDPSVDVLQVASSLLDQRLARAGFFEEARKRKLKIVVRSVFLQGVAHLEIDALPPHLQPLAQPLQRIDDWAKSHSLRRSDAFLLYARDMLDATPVLGCESLGQLLDNSIAWRSCEVERAALDDLAKDVAELDPALLDPARW